MLRRASRGPIERLLSFSTMALVVLLGACNSVDFGNASVPAIPSDAHPYNPDDAAVSDAATADAFNFPVSDAAYTGNPLCNAQAAAGCYPDDAPTTDTCPPAEMAGDAAVPAVDAGDAASPPPACRVAPSAGQPVCVKAGTGEDGAACQSGADCAAGFECVGTTGQCRHYCCMADACDSLPHPAFCDVQSLAVSDTTKVPVCMPVSACKLLSPTGCMAGETCEVVRPDGTTSCVAVGTAQAGDPCDVEHCASGLTCLGSVGSRVCYQLCAVVDSSAACPAGTTCQTTAPTFQDPTVGICTQ